MTSHDLANILLAAPDTQIVVNAVPGITDHLNDIYSVERGVYPSPSWSDEEGKENPVIVINTHLYTVNEDEAYTKKEAFS